MHGQSGVDEVDRLHEIGLRGVAWHHRFQGCYIDSRWMWPTLERMARYGMVAMVHANAESSLESPWRLQRLAKSFPQLAFVALDAFWSYERTRDVLSRAADTPNVIWDMGGPVCYLSEEESIKMNGSEALCFSADRQYDARTTSVRPALLQRLESAAISDEDRSKTLGLNVAKAFRLLDEPSGL